MSLWLNNTLRSQIIHKNNIGKSKLFPYTFITKNILTKWMIGKFYITPAFYGVDEILDLSNTYSMKMIEINVGAKSKLDE